MRAPDQKNPASLVKLFNVGILLLVTFMLSTGANAQVKDSATITREKIFKNTIKVNLTSWILYSNGIQLNYERILSPNRSITVFGGLVQFPMPTIISNSSLNFDKNKSKSGYVFGSEYRFYLAKENKYAAPHGVYLAPFVSFYHFHNERSGRDTITQSNAYLSTTMNFFNVGGELGYQFVIKKRFVVDCVMFGPALSSYYFNIKLVGNLGSYNEDVQAIIDAIKEKYPVLKDLSSGEGISKNGISNFWSFGFRYAIHIGYRF